MMSDGTYVQPAQPQIKVMIISSCLGSLVTILVISFLLRNTSFVNIYLPAATTPHTADQNTADSVYRLADTKGNTAEMGRRAAVLEQITAADSGQRILGRTRDTVGFIRATAEFHQSVGSGNKHRIEEEGFTRRSSRDVQLILLKSAVKQGAVCLDGSPPGYYYREGSGKGSDNWVLHFFGGAWCYDEEACLQRSKTVLGSSKFFPEHPPKLQGVLSGDARINPDFHDWNLVMICYCDGASFTGYRTEPVSIRGELIYMRGKRILEAIMDQLLSSQFSKAKRVLLTGTSAGGLSVVLHADYIRNKLPKSMALRAMSDSGYFVDIASLNGGNIINRHFKRMFEVHNSTAGVQQDCVRDAEPGYQWKCLFPQHTFRFLSTPIFILQSAYDAWQIIHVRGVSCEPPDYREAQRMRTNSIDLTRGHVSRRSLPNKPHPSWAYRHIHGIYCKPPECTSRELKAIMQYRNITLHALHPVLRSRTSGLLLTSCMEHSQSLYDDTWTKLYVNGLPVSEIVGDWYFERSNGHHHVDCDYPCNPSCENIG